MSSKYIDITIDNHSLSAYSNAPSGWLPAVIGTCTGVAPGVCADFTLENIRSAGVGPAASCALALLTAGAPILTIVGATPLASETTTGLAVAPTRVGSSTGTITAAGTPVDHFMLRIECTVTGATNLLAVFRYSLDDGLSWVGTFTGSATQLLSAQTGSTTISSGVTVTLAAGTYDAGDVFSVMVWAPQIDTTDASVGSIASSFTLMKGDGYRNMVVIANVPQKGTSNSPTDTLNGTAWQAAWTKITTAQAILTGIQYICLVFFNTSLKLDGTDETDATFLGLNYPATAARTNFGAIGVGHTLQQSNGAYYTWAPEAWSIAARLLENNNPIKALYDLNVVSMQKPGVRTGVVGLLRTYTGEQQYGSTFNEQKTISGNDGWAAPNSIIALQTDRNGPNQPIESNYYFSSGVGADTPTSDFYELAYAAQMAFFIPAVIQGCARWRGAGPDKNVIPKADGSGQLTNATIAMIEEDITKFVQAKLTNRGWILPPPNGAKYITLAKTTDVVRGKRLVGKASFPAPGYIKYFTLSFSVSI
jgi:hypothetical protein